MIRSAKIDWEINILTLRQEILLLPSTWSPHFNTQHYEGEWTVLPLRAPGGHHDRIIPDLMQEGEYQDTPLMQNCPAIRQLISTFQCPIRSVRLLNLKRGAIIKEHRDHELAFEHGEARLHIPVFTNEHVEFFVQQERIIMEPGECWYINANLPHRVANYGPTDRIHLVIDCTVNDWLRELFERSPKTTVAEERKTGELLKMIFELRLQNTDITNKLADELEQSLLEQA
ncbi:aspartyl/asparaginyl beta-hydroxylase domain-containing protein [Paraflavitalea sp. CAU 1676]|uniref:aspartyl/asparaginyl beta-hydroxylase domain-containing protein n=1 Tax=Paraflavitalea sp. CAU 1676 TaxID=3032598 RepID=UPI0023DC74BF|nr:aspartyl/asparaginyl beta-hydroxylase domain-containing protein [Paraflavitalea sp. CAU 1676]MDF2186944.1 aspartyl/asparaginyl beta-hydroxylase domain-containing protein [Paraflavitalea sp. CAU 1676]